MPGGTGSPNTFTPDDFEPGDGEPFDERGRVGRQRDVVAEPGERNEHEETSGGRPDSFRPASGTC